MDDRAVSETIYFDVAAAVHSRAGLGRYAESLVRALLEEHDGAFTLFYNADPTAHPLTGLDHVPQRTVVGGYKRWRMQVWLAQILRLRFGLEDGTPQTLEQVGRALGLSRERIRQIERQALRQLRQPQFAHMLRDFLV